MPSVLGNRAEPVVAGEPAARARLQAAEVEVALVVDDEELLGVTLKNRARRRDRPARQVHVELGLQQPESGSPSANFRELTGELALKPPP